MGDTRKPFVCPYCYTTYVHATSNCVRNWQLKSQPKSRTSFRILIDHTKPWEAIRSITFLGIPDRALKVETSRRLLIQSNPMIPLDLHRTP